MGCRNLLGGWFGAALIGAAALVTPPLLFGGGGDEGIDILPFRGGGDASGSRSDGAAGLGVPERPAIGWIAVHGKTVKLDANGRPDQTGLVLHSHSRTDLFVGTVGSEPDPFAVTTLDLLTKGPRKLIYGEFLPAKNALGGEAFLNLNGRFELAVLDDSSGGSAERLELIGRERKPAVLTVMVGHRSTRNGAIGPSFTQVDSTVTDALPSGAIDLLALREALLVDHAGSGVDIAIVLSTTTARGVEEAWASFHADDSEPRFDLEIRIP